MGGSGKYTTSTAAQSAILPCCGPGLEITNYHYNHYYACYVTFYAFAARGANTFYAMFNHTLLHEVLGPEGP